MRRLAILSLFFVFGNAAGLSAADTPEGRLVWENGDVLSGSVVRAGEGRLLWQSPVFSTPFSLNVDRLKSIHFPAVRNELDSNEPVRFATHSGDVLHGRLVGVTDEHLVLDSRRHGRVQVLRTALRSFGRIDPRALGGDSGPPKTGGWRALSTTQTISQWKTDAAGRLSTQILDAELGGDFKLPEIAEFDMALSWKDSPRFVVTFGSVRAVRFGGDVVRIQADEDQLALVGAGQTRPKVLMPLTARDNRVRLRILWNRVDEELAVYTSAGDPLGKARIAAAAGTGMHIKNRGRDLTVEHLRMRSSTGAVAREPAGGEAYIRLFDGSAFVARLVGLEKTSGDLIVDDPVKGRRRVAMDTVVSVHFTSKVAEQAAPTQLKVRYYDGTLLTGTLLSADDEKLSLQTSFSRQPVSSRLVGVREVLFLSDRRLPAPGDLDILEIGGDGGGILHGRLAAADGAGDVLGWQPVGSDAASAFAGTHPVRFVRRAKEPETAAAVADVLPVNPFAANNPDAAARKENGEPPGSDVLYLDNGDMILCRVQALDSEDTTVTSDLFDTQKIPTRRIKAIEFNSESFVPFKGFEGDDWVVTQAEENAVNIMNDTVAFRGRATLAHNGLLQGDELQFDVLWNPETRCVLTINLYANDARRSTGIPLMLYFMEQNLLVRGPNARGFIQHAPARAEVAFNRLGGVAVNNVLLGRRLEEQVVRFQELQKVLADRENALQALRLQLKDADQPRIRDQLEAVAVRQQAVAKQMKEAQAALAAQRAAAAEQPAMPQPQENLRRATIRFVHKGKSLEINIDNSQSFSQPIAERDDLAGKGIQFTVQPVAVRRVRVVDANGRIRQVEPEPQDSDLLRITNLVVSRSGNAMRFLRIDDDQMQSVLTIPRSRKRNPPTHLLVAQNGDLLRGQLVSMTDERIQFRSRLDTFTFDRARVAAIVSLQGEDEEAADASLDGDRTVRVVLSDGTRLTFAMQESIQQTLRGEHPLFGACNILVDHVHELQTGGQVRAWPTDLAYDEWRMVPAKEPIFPGAGEGGAMPGLGEDSPLVGTPAEDFVAPLIDGTPFRLAEHSDKIVVLDFWATWCGPCARALPQIVEAVGQFPPEDVIFVAVNQQETEAAVREYLSAREWDFTVALDRDGQIGRQYQVEAIPQTVIVGKGGKIERLHVGAHPNLQQELVAVLQELLAPPADAEETESN